MNDNQRAQKEHARVSAFKSGEGHGMSEENARNAAISAAHKENYDINRAQLDLQRMDSLKKEGKNPAEYGYDENKGYTR